MTIGAKIAIKRELPRRLRMNAGHIRRAVSMTVAAAAAIAALAASMNGVNPRLMLKADADCGVVPYAFYVTGDIVVALADAAAYERAARRAFIGSGSSAVEVGVTQTGGMACVAVSVTIPPNERQAAETVRRIRTAFGSSASVAVCLTGYTNEPTGSFAIESALRLAGGTDGMNAAVRENGEVYLGMPWIPITY
ncbi:MAG: hypothetical protein LBB86_08305 [Oscillospiraceae bacterium]|nr:hypothetical protein [Oscillospiraceae bacterium]